MSVTGMLGYFVFREGKVSGSLSVSSAIVIYSGIVLFLSAILVLAIRSIVLPLHKLAMASAEISNGNLNREINIKGRKGEIGIISRSLHRMVEQLRVNMHITERSNTVLDIYTRLNHALYEKDSLEAVFDEIIESVCEYFKLSGAYLVFLAEGKASVVSASSKDPKPEFVKGDDFPRHKQIALMIRERRIVSFNGQALENAKLKIAAGDLQGPAPNPEGGPSRSPFLSKALSLCIVPVRQGSALRAYLIMEGTEPFVHNDSVLLFMSDTVSYILSKKANEAWVPADKKSKPERSAFLKTLSHIDSLDIEQGMLYAGGGESGYTEVLHAAAETFHESAETMKTAYKDKLPDFAIHVHGIKGALYSIGAVSLGDRALELEKAAKAENSLFCADTYPLFEEDLLRFTEALEAALSVEKT
jgi:HAMP domain-containing protein/HPt (histidine-containing phosphotransfer) domain-containing protein